MLPNVGESCWFGGDIQWQVELESYLGSGMTRTCMPAFIMPAFIIYYAEKKKPWHFQLKKLSLHKMKLQMKVPLSLKIQGSA